jgi:hypothetical protein
MTSALFIGFCVLLWSVLFGSIIGKRLRVVRKTTTVRVK